MLTPYQAIRKQCWKAQTGWNHKKPNSLAWVLRPDCFIRCMFLVASYVTDTSRGPLEYVPWIQPSCIPPVFVAPSIEAFWGWANKGCNKLWALLSMCCRSVGTALAPTLLGSHLHGAGHTRLLTKRGEQEVLKCLVASRANKHYFQVENPKTEARDIHGP
jgi:hypothetical protein